MTPFLTIGMACYQDFDQVWFTVQALRMRPDFDPKTTEILVIDNFGDDRLQRFVESWTDGQARYVRWTEVQGTAPPKGRVFDEARGEWVICIDSHVLLWEGALARFHAWAAAHPGCRDLLHGPLWHTHLRDGMDRLHTDTIGGDGVWGTWRGGSPPLDAEPYEIPKMGMGLFGCRREVWHEVGGFHPALRRFGGEEHVIHEKWRRRSGGRVTLLPFLRWIHLFRDGKSPYPSSDDDKIRNVLLGCREAGIDPAPVFEKWGDRARRIDSPPGPDLYPEAASAPSDMVEHVPTLASLGAGKRVIEFGVRSGVSTAAFIHGKPRRLISYDIAPCPREAALRAYAIREGVGFDFRIGDSTKVQAEPADVIFIDTLHTAAQLRAELANLAPKAQRIVLHDTVTFGRRGEDGGPGLLDAVDEFLPTGWVIEEDHPNCHGLMVLRRAA